MTPSLRREGDVFLLHLGDGENRFDPAWIEAVTACLREAEAAPEPRALVTYATGKHWSNGMDLKWVQAHGRAEREAFFLQFHRFLGDVLVASIPTVAAVTGHAFAAGLLLAVGHDRRVMRRDAGFLCLPEVDLGMAFTPGIVALVQAKLPPALAAEMMLTGRRYTGADALAAGLVDATADVEGVLPAAIAMAQALAGKPARAYAQIKRRLYHQAAEELAAGAM